MNFLKYMDEIIKRSKEVISKKIDDNIQKEIERDMFSPTQEPAKTIYDAFQEEAKKRDDRDFNEWIYAERLAVYLASVECAKKYKLKELTMKDVERAENYACGSCDYGSKWAYKIVDMMREEK